MRLIVAVFACLAAIGVGSHLFMVSGLDLWLAWLAGPILGLLAGLRHCRPARLDPAPGRRWLLIAGWIAIGGLGGAVAWGSMATPSRHWDGHASWEPRAAWLATQPSLEQPFFRDPAVYHPNRDYPLLQPVCLAACKRLLGEDSGRIWFAFLYLLFCGVVFVTLRRIATADVAVIVTLAAAVTPTLVAPTGGAADSGYGEMLLLTTLTAAAAGLLLADRWLMGYASICLVLCKPEGALYAATIILTAMSRTGGLGPARSVLLISGGSIVLLTAVQRRLLGSIGSTVSMAIFIVLAMVVALGADFILQRTRMTGRNRLLVVAAGMLAVIVAMPLLAGPWIDADGAVGSYLTDAKRALGRLPRLPAILLGETQHALHPRRFGLTFWCVPVAGWMVWRRPHAVSSNSLVLLLLGFASVTAAFLLSPETDLTHHMRSSMDRLLLHWIGVAWLLVGAASRAMPMVKDAPFPSSGA